MNTASMYKCFCVCLRLRWPWALSKTALQQWWMAPSNLMSKTQSSYFYISKATITKRVRTTILRSVCTVEHFRALNKLRLINCHEHTNKPAKQSQTRTRPLIKAQLSRFPHSHSLQLMSPADIQVRASESLLSVLLSLGTAAPFNEEWAEGLRRQDADRSDGVKSESPRSWGREANLTLTWWNVGTCEAE